MVNIINRLMCCIIVLALPMKKAAQLSGTYTIPTDFVTLSAAISALNVQGVNGAVVIEIPAGYTETAPAGGYGLTATGTVLHPITFRKSGIGANPLITAYSGGTGTPSSAIQDGVWRFIGCDYITVDGIDITDPNTTNPSTMEYGLGFFKAGSSDGCHNNIVRNCIINLRVVNNANGAGPSVEGSRGINMVSALYTSQTTVNVPVSFAGTNSNNTFYGNTLRNCNVGIALIGYTAPGPFTLADRGNMIGGSGLLQGNVIVNFGGAAGATNPCAGIRTLAQYNLQVLNNILNNNDGTGSNHTNTIRGIYVNTAQSANVIISNNTLTLNSGAASLQVSAIENAAGATAANNTVTISGNSIKNCSNASNTTGSFFGIYNNAASSEYLNIENNVISEVNTRATTGACYLIYNTGQVSSSVTIVNNLIANCTNTATTSGAYYAIYNNASFSAALALNSNSLTNITSLSATGATYLIYNANAAGNGIRMNENLFSHCSHSITSSGAFYGVFNNGTSPFSLEINGNVFLNHTVQAFSGATHLIYNTAPAAGSIMMNNNTISGSVNTVLSTGSCYSIYNNSASSSSLSISNNSITTNTWGATTGSVHLIYNRGAATNTFNVGEMNNNFIANCSHTATSNSPFLAISNQGVTSDNLSVSNNTITNSLWQTATSIKYLLFNTGNVNAVLNMNNNLLANCSSTNNTTGSFNGITNSGTCNTALNMCGNTFTNISNSATNGGTYVMFNSGVLSGGALTITNNAVSDFSNSATGTGFFYGIYNSATTFSTLTVSDNSLTGNYTESFTGVNSLIYNTGAVNTAIGAIHLTDNLIANCTNSTTSNGGYFAIYNNAASCETLNITGNTFTNNVMYAANGGNHLIYNRGAITNTFSSVNLNNNLISGCTHYASAGAGFYSIWNNGVTSTLTSITNNTITGSSWESASALRYLISNWGVAVDRVTISENLISNCTHTNNTTGSLFGIYNNNNTAVSSGTLIIRDNSFRDNVSSATTGLTHYIASNGITSNTFTTIELSNNTVDNCESRISGNGMFYGIYNNTTSADDLVISQNTFTNVVLTSSTGATYFIYNQGVNNSVFNNLSIRNNLISGITHSNNANGIFYGILSVGTVSTNCSVLSIANNTLANGISFSTTGPISLLHNTCPATSSISLNNNVFANWTNTLTTTGGFFALNNAAPASAQNLLITGNLFTGLSSGASTAAKYFVNNSAAISHSVSITQNTITGCSHSVTGNGSLYGLQNNNSTSAASVRLSENVFLNNSSSLVNGGTFLISNAGVSANTLTSVSFANNSIGSYTSNSSSGNFYALFNNGFTTGNISVSSNTLSDMVLNSTGTHQYQVFNGGAVLNSADFLNNVCANYTNTLNTTGAFYNIYNTATSQGDLNVTGNVISNHNLSATSGSAVAIYNVGVIQQNISFGNNLISHFTYSSVAAGGFSGVYNNAAGASSLTIRTNTLIHVDVYAGNGGMQYFLNRSATTASINTVAFTDNAVAFCSYSATSGPFYGVFNSGTSITNLNVQGNSFHEITHISTTGLRCFINNNGAASSEIIINTNVISGYTSSLTAGGAFYNIFNSGLSSGDLHITANTFSTQTLTTSTGISYLVYNTGVVSNSVNIRNNLAADIFHTSTSGAFYGIFNNGTSCSDLSVNGNTLTTISTNNATGLKYLIYNTSASVNGARLNNNFISGYSAPLNTTGAFAGLFNAGGGGGSLEILGNQINATNLRATSGIAYLVYNTGVVAHSVSISNNLVSNVTHSSTTGVLYGIYNNGTSCTDLSVIGNTLAVISTSNATAVKYLVYNSSAGSNSIRLDNNLISDYAAPFNTTGMFAGVYNTGNSQGDFSANGNVFNHVTVPATTGTCYVIYNTGTVAGMADYMNNSIENLVRISSGAGTLYGIYNLASASTALTIYGNTFSNSFMEVPSLPAYLFYNAANAATTIQTVNMSNNTVINFTNNSGSGAFYGVFNNAVSSFSLAMSGNTFSNCVSQTTVSPHYLIHNTGTAVNDMRLTNNRVSNYTNTLNTSADFYGVYNTANCNGNLEIANNLFTDNLLQSITGDNYFLYNSGNVAGETRLNDNTISGTTNLTTANGGFYGVYNTGQTSGKLSIDGNALSNNSSAAVTANTYLLYNAGVTTSSISVSSNTLGFGYTNGSVDYSGTLYGIYNTGGAASTTLNISDNVFSGYSFSGLPGSGNIYFIHNTNDNSRFDITNNSWVNLSLYHNGNEYLIYNPSSTSLQLNVNANSVTGYTRTANAASLYMYYSNGSSPSSCVQVFSGNHFSGISAPNLGTGSFYGIYNSDGSGTSYPRKIVSDNLISAVNYNGLGFCYGYYFDFLGDFGSIGSSVHNNTLTGISWGGPLYPLYLGSNVSNNHAAEVYANVMYSLTCTEPASYVYGAYLMGGGAGLNFYKNKISDIVAGGAFGKADGLHVFTATNTDIYNNLIGNVATPSSSVVASLNGIHIAGGDRVNVFYNTVRLSATGLGNNFGSNALYASATVTLTLRNNILINTSVATGSGITAAYRRSAASFVNYTAASNNNIFYAGIPSANNLLYADGMQASQTLPGYKALVTPMDALSESENTTFLSVSGANTNFLHVDATIPSLTESGATAIPNITDDVDADIRHGSLGYAGTGTAPDIGADEYAQNLVPCSSVSSGTVIAPLSATVCDGKEVYMLSSGHTAAGSIVYQWKVASSSGGPYIDVSGGTGANTPAYTTPDLNAGMYYYVLVTTCTINSLTATSNELTVTVQARPTASISILNDVICSGQSLIFTGNSTIGSSYHWQGPGNFVSVNQNPVITNALTTSSGVYTLLVSDANCISHPAFAGATVNPSPPSFTLSPSAASVCIGNSQTISASLPIVSPTLNFGNQTTLNTASGYPAPYSAYYGGQKMQILILSGELAAAGFTTGTPIQSIQFPVSSFGANWTTSIHDCQNFMIGAKLTSVNALTTFETGLTNVVPATNYTPVTGYNNIHLFSAPLIWDGISNLVLETVFSNSIIGTSANAVFQYRTPTAFPSTLVYRADNQDVSVIAAATSSNTNVGFVRPDFRLNGTQIGTYSWTPSDGLSSTTSVSVVASPTASTVYSVALSDGQCASTTTMALEVILVPTVNVTSSSSVVCLGNTATLTANGAATYTWSTGSTNTAIIAAPFVSTTYSVTGANPACPHATASVHIISAPALILTAQALPAVLCQGDSSTLTVSGASTYTWTGGVNSASMAVSPLSTTAYTVLGYDGPGCWASRSVAVHVNPLPIISISPTLNTICSGESLTLEASGVFSFTWSPGNSNSPILTVNPVASVVYTVTGIDLNNCMNSASVAITVDPCTGMGKDVDLTKDMVVYPNPSSGVFTVQFRVEGYKRIAVENALGALIYEVGLTGISEKIDLSGLAKGAYFMRVEDGINSTTYKLILND